MLIRCLNADEKSDPLTVCLHFEDDSSTFVDQPVTMEETGVYHRDLEPKRATQTVKEFRFPPPKKFVV